MKLKIFVDMPVASASIHINLLDCDVEGSAVWVVRVKGKEDVYVEGHIGDDIFVIADRASKAYES